MLEVRAVFTEEEAKQLKKAKGAMSWRDFILNGRKTTKDRSKR